MKCKIIDSMEALGGQVSAMYPEKDIFDVAGFPRVSGKQLVADLEEQLSRFQSHHRPGREGFHLGQTSLG